MQASGENYLEIIYRLKQQSEGVRSIDVAKATGYSKPSISRGMARLKKEDVITIDEKGIISLTPKGQTLAETLIEKHSVIKTFLLKYTEVNEEIADTQAGEMKHVLNDEVFEAMKKTLKQNMRRGSGGLHQRR